MASLTVISGGHLRLYYQPITNGNNKTIIGYEALMRWHHPVRGLIMPNDFIPIAEETSLIHVLGTFALYEACREAASWEGALAITGMSRSLDIQITVEEVGSDEHSLSCATKVVPCSKAFCLAGRSRRSCG